MAARDVSIGTESGERPFEYPVRVLFLCTGNSARSQIAEALLRQKGGHRFIVASAGAEPASSVRPEAVDVLREQGIEWSAATPKGLDAVTDERWDLVITLCDRTRESCASLAGRPVTAHWGVPDPASAGSARASSAFAETLALLSWRLDLMLALRLDQFEAWVLEQRLNEIARITEHGNPVRPSMTPGSSEAR